jgi:hypothetical protein
MYRIYFLILASIFPVSCNQISRKERNTIYETKGLSLKENYLKPLIIKTSKEIYQLVEIRKKNCIGTVNSRGEFSILTIHNTGRVSVNNIVRHFPPDFGDKIESDPEHNMMWLIHGRGIYILDMESRKTAHVLASNNPNDRVMNTFLLEPEKKLFYVGLANAGIHDIPFSYALIDFNQKIKTFESPLMRGILYPIGNNLFLYQEYSNAGTTFKWYISGLDINEKKENKLTRKLTKLQIDTWSEAKTIHIGKRMMLGESHRLDKAEFFSVCWDEDFEDAKIELIISQIPDGGLLNNLFSFSFDGNWVKSTIEFGKIPTDTPRLVIYPVGSIYPQGVGMPIICGITHDSSPGAFMDHEKWGTCYVEQDRDYDDILFVYKLNEGMKILAEHAKERFSRE